MANVAKPAHESPAALRNYYLLRAGVAAVWVLAAFTIGAANPLVGGALLVLYPAWDAVANVRDALANGGLRANRPQALNVLVSGIVAIAVAAALPISMHLVLGIVGGWAILSGALQLAVGVRRWREYGAQWAMALSGVQSALAGGFFMFQTSGPAVPSVTTVAPYAAFGAFYFLVSAVVLTVKGHRKPRRGGRSLP
jgi:uncharacterized membrane protein HdeD (DUF308 family)